MKRKKEVDITVSPDGGLPVVRIALADLIVDPVPSKSQRNKSDEEAVLASVMLNGLDGAFPLWVVQDPDGSRGKIVVDGEVRLRGARQRGDLEAPCIVLNMTLAKARKLAARRNSQIQEVVKHVPLAQVLIKQLEAARVRELPDIKKVIEIPEEVKRQIAKVTRTSVTTIERALTPLRRLYQDFSAKNPSFANPSVFEVFSQIIEDSPKSAVAWFHRGDLSVHAFGQNWWQLEYQPPVERTRGKNPPYPSIDLTDSSAPPRDEAQPRDSIEAATALTNEAAFTDGPPHTVQPLSGIDKDTSAFVNRFAHLLTSIENLGSTPKKAYDSDVIAELEVLYELSPSKMSILCQLAAVITHFAKQHRWCGCAKPTPDACVPAIEDAASSNQILLF